MIRLGICADGRELTYDVGLYEFRLEREVVSYERVGDPRLRLPRQAGMAQHHPL